MVLGWAGAELGRAGLGRADQPFCCVPSIETFSLSWLFKRVNRDIPTHSAAIQFMKYLSASENTLAENKLYNSVALVNYLVVFSCASLAGSAHVIVLLSCL